MIKKIKLACVFLICLICLFILIDEVKAQIVVPTPMLVDSDENEAINSQKPIISGLKRDCIIKCVWYNLNIII
ncbi:MAG: hypothetical protein ABIA02_04345 [Candidatus Falkowbacteria bacterium]